jgi:hypothetical protein
MKVRHRGAFTNCQVQSEGQVRTATGTWPGVQTLCQAQSEGLVRRAKKGQPARGTHGLSSAERDTGQDSKEKLVVEIYDVQRLA